MPVEGRDGTAALGAVERLVDELVAAVPAGRLLGIGVGTPGLVDTTSGEIKWAVNLDWQDLPLGRILSERTGLPAFVANDSRAAAMGEYLFDVGRRAPNLVAIKIGHGIGAGIVLGGELFEGDGFGAGEIGHTSVVDDGVECRCGRFGCLETVASSRAVVEQAVEAAAANPAARWPAGSQPRPASHPSTTSPPRSRTATRTPGPSPRPPAGGSGRAVAALIGTLDIHHVVLLGTVTHLGEPWLDAVRDEAARRALDAAVARDPDRGRRGRGGHRRCSGRAPCS